MLVVILEPPGVSPPGGSLVLLALLLRLLRRQLPLDAGQVLRLDGVVPALATLLLPLRACHVTPLHL